MEEGSLPIVEEAKIYLDFAKSVAATIKSELGSRQLKMSKTKKDLFK